MKRFILLILFQASLLCNVTAQGKYAGTFKKLIGKKFINESELKALAGYTFNNGSMITDINDPELMIVNVYKKGTTRIVLFSLLTDSVNRGYEILDVIEIKNFQKGWEIKTAVCRQGESDNMEIVAVAKPGTNEITRNIKQAWRCNRDKRRIELLPVKGVSCLNEGMEQF